MFKILSYLCLLLAWNTNATLITETWKTTLTGGHPSLYSKGYAKIGDELFWTVSYFDDARGYHRWSDGDNRMAEFGANDDVLISDVYAYYASDAMFNLNSFDSISDAFMLGESRTNHDRYTYNFSFTNQNSFTKKREFAMQKDNLFFIVDLSGQFAYSSGVAIYGISEFVQNGIITVSEPKDLSFTLLVFPFLLMNYRNRHY